MKKQMRFLIVTFITVAVIVTAGILLYRHFVTDSVKDKGGMERDWQSEMYGQWIGHTDGYENVQIILTEGKVQVLRETEILYDSSYTVDENQGYLILNKEENPPFTHIEMLEQSLSAETPDGTSVLFEKRTEE